MIMNNIFKSSKDIEAENARLQEENARLQEELKETKEQAQRIERTFIIATIAIRGIGVATSAIAAVKNAKLKLRTKKAEKEAISFFDEVTANKTEAEKAEASKKLDTIFDKNKKVSMKDLIEDKKAEKAAKKEEKKETATEDEEITENQNNEDIPESVSGEK